MKLNKSFSLEGPSTFTAICEKHTGLLRTLGWKMHSSLHFQHRSGTLFFHGPLGVRKVCLEHAQKCKNELHLAISNIDWKQH